MKNSRFIALVGLALGSIVCLGATPAKGLTVGSKAPPLSVERWIKGDEVKTLDEGTSYVVEFWATWCPPCVKSIPHLSELQKKYPGVVMIGVAASERNPDPAVLDSFVAGQGDKMSYRVAADSDRSMSKEWMEAAAQRFIPVAFVVDAKGILAYIGSPMDAGFAKAVRKVAKSAETPADKPDGKPVDASDKPADVTPPKDEPKGGSAN
ncbi:MAG: TlpA disulfide reductase family protein [Planctomycetota bacterium]|nr:TlpA disulfide reductase family protein [Planctomycetota bacterium]